MADVRLAEPSEAFGLRWSHVLFNEDGTVPCTLRHTALTRLGAKAGGDVFVLARIAGHSSIMVTQRYIHPQADAINRVFAASQSQS
jgi:integrase